MDTTKLVYSYYSLANVNQGYTYILETRRALVLFRVEGNVTAFLRFWSSREL